MIVTAFILSIIGVVMIFIGFIVIMVRQSNLESYIVRHEKKLEASLDRSFSNEEKTSMYIEKIYEKVDEFDHDCSKLLAKVDKLSMQTTAALKGVDKDVVEMLKSLIIAIDNQDAIRLSQVIRSVKTTIERNDSVVEAIENCSYTTRGHLTIS